MASCTVRSTSVSSSSIASYSFIVGMSDSLTDYLVGRIKSTTPCVIKYVPYGALVEVGIHLASSRCAPHEGYATT